MSCWAVRLPLGESETAVRLWRVDGVEVCRAGEDLWLRGSELDESLDARLRAMPGAARFLVANDGQLRAPGARVPDGWLPRGPWVPLRDWFQIKLPVTKLPGQSADRVPLQLVPATRAGEPAALLTQLETWVAYAADAPQVRLDRWRFAVAEDGRVLVHGQPLPPLPGDRLIDDHGILVPVGWTWSPPVEAAVIRSLLDVAPDDFMIWYPHQSWERVPGDQLVQATRSAARCTVERFRHD